MNITTDDNDNPYLIFESLNNKGEALTQADLVRNYIFMKLPIEERDEIYNNQWLPLQEKFKKNANHKDYAGELTKAFWFYLRKDGLDVNEKEVYKSIKNKFDALKLTNELKDELENIIKFSNYYLCLNFNDEETEIKLKQRFERLRRLEFTTCQIFLLNVYHQYEEEELSLEDFEKILIYLESYFIRRWFADISTRNLGSVFNKLYDQVKQKDTGNLVNGLYTVLSEFDKKERYPNDDEFRQAVISKSLYKSTGSNDRVKLILESIEASLSKERVAPESLNIEHIMPQSLSKEWKTMLGENHANLHKKWLHTLGNLTLTGYNSELSNKPFKEKSAHLQKNSNLSLNKYYQQKKVDIWNEEAIKNRAEYLADAAVKIWLR